MNSNVAKPRNIHEQMRYRGRFFQLDWPLSFSVASLKNSAAILTRCIKAAYENYPLTGLPPSEIDIEIFDSSTEFMAGNTAVERSDFGNYGK